MRNAGLSSAIRLDDKLTDIDAVAGWRRWLAQDAQRGRGLLISRPVDANASPAPGEAAHAALLRHPGLARVLEARVDSAGLRVVEEIGSGHALNDRRCRLPRGDALALQLLRLLEALAYLHREGQSHGALSRTTIFCDGKRLTLTGSVLRAGARAMPSADVRDWSELTAELLRRAPGGERTELVREAARQALVALDDGRTLNAVRVAHAVHRALGAEEHVVEPVAKPATASARAETDESESYAAPRSRGMQIAGSIARGALTTLLTIALVAGVVSLGLFLFLRQLPREVRVPTLTGLERQDAEDRLKQDGLRVGPVRSVYREEVEPGHVAETSPPAGMTVRQGREVTLVLSMGAARVKVPRVVGLRVDEAESVLEKQGLKLVDGGRQRSSASEGEIVDQEPSAGNRIAQGQRVLVRVSGGPEFGVVELAGDDDDGSAPLQMVFRRVEIVVPQGDALQRVVVREGYGEELESTYDRLHRPGDRVKLDTYGRPGKQIRVLVEGDEVFKTTL